MTDARSKRIDASLDDFVNELRAEYGPGDQPQTEPTGAAEPNPIPPTAAPIANQLTGVARLLDEDSREELARVRVSKWRVRVYVYDPANDDATPLDDDESDFAGYYLAQAAMPICNAQPDLLAWLKDRDMVGSIALEWLPPRSKKSNAIKHFLHVPEPLAQEPVDAEPVVPAGSTGSDAGRNLDPVTAAYERMIQQMADDKRDLMQVIDRMSESHERALNRVSEQAEMTLNDLRDTWREQLEHDPARQIGIAVQKRAIEDVQDNLAGGREKRKRQMQDLLDEIDDEKSLKEKLAKRLALRDAGQTPEPNDPLNDTLNDLIRDIGPAYLRQKLGLPPKIPTGMADATKSGDMGGLLDTLNAEGERLLDNAGEDAA